MTKKAILPAALAALAVCVHLGLPSAAHSKKAPAAGYDRHNVVIVLDASGSMKETMGGSSMRKIDAAKRALREVLKTVPKDTQIGLLVFSASNLSEDWVYPLGPRDDNRLMRAIDLPEPGGQTPLGAYIKKGADALLAQREKQFGYGSYRLLVVTDGEAQDKDLVRRYVPQVMARGITTDAIGVAMRSDHTLATQVHSYRRADDPRALKRAIAQVFAEVSTTGSGAIDQDAFDQLAPIPDELAQEMLAALAISGNHPIGEQARSLAAAEPDAGASRTTGNKPSVKEPSSSGKGKSSTTWIFVTVGVVVALYFVFKRKRA